MKIEWCSVCNAWYIECPRCGNNSCNGGSGEDGKCPVCIDVYKLQDTISQRTGKLLKRLVKPEQQALRGEEATDG